MSQTKNSLKKELTAVLREDDNYRQMLRAVVGKAIEGDMKAFDVIRDILDQENPEREDNATLTIRLGAGIEELAR